MNKNFLSIIMAALLSALVVDYSPAIAAEQTIDDLLRKSSESAAGQTSPSFTVPQLNLATPQVPAVEQLRTPAVSKIKAPGEDQAPVVTREVLPMPKDIPALSALEKMITSDETLQADKVSDTNPARTLTQFGYNFFKTTAFAPLTDVPVSNDYLTGPGDTLVLNVWGSVEGTYELTVSRSGEVFLPKVGPVKASGIPFGKLRDIFRLRLAREYRDFDLSVNMGKLRTVKVYVVGEVHAPGDYSLSSLSTLINALSAAGGPTKNGSLRNIQVRHADRTHDTIDLYDFFTHGDKSRDVRLNSGDTVFVPVIGKVAAISGNVRRPAIYELKTEKTLKDLLELAGGVTATGYLQRVQISRVVANEKKNVIDLNLDPRNTAEKDPAAGIQLQDLDIVRVFPINNLLRDHFSVTGHLQRPGSYALTPGMRISSVIKKEQLLPEYYSKVMEVTRLTPPDLHPEKIIVDMEAALAGAPASDLEIREFDVLRVFSKLEMEENPKVRIGGEVQKPGEHRLLTGMTVRDLIIQAGNPKTTAYLKSAELRRLDFSGANITPSSTYFNLEAVLNGSAPDNFALKPFDEVVVKKWFAKEDLPVFISGEVRNPGTYRFVTGMTIRDLIIEAGNTKKTAYLKDAEITRQKVEGNTVKTYPIHVNLEESLSEARIHNVPLEPYDVVVIRKIPYWTEETERFATIGGEVMFPGTYPIYRGERLSNLIERAGGFTDKGYLHGIRFTRELARQVQQQRMDEALVKVHEDILRLQGKIAQSASSREEADAARANLENLSRTADLLKTKKAEGRMIIRIGSLEEFKGSIYDIELQAGDLLTVPKDPGGVNVIGEVYNQTTVITQPDRSVDWYLDQVGGATGDAEKSEMYVVHADGTVVSKQNSASLLFYNFFGWKTLDSGDTIIVPRQIERTAWIKEIKDIVTILGQIALSAGVLIAADL